MQNKTSRLFRWFAIITAFSMIFPSHVYAYGLLRKQTSRNYYRVQPARIIHHVPYQTTVVKPTLAPVPPKEAESTIVEKFGGYPPSVKSSIPEETPQPFSLLALCSTKNTLGHRNTEVKAAQEETPVNILNISKKQVKANQEDTAVIAPPANPDSFILARSNQDIAQYNTPETEIMGADQEYEVGELIELWVKPLSNRPENLHSVDYVWTILPIRPVRIWPDSTRILFGTGKHNTTHVIILNAAYVFVERDEDGKILEVHQRSTTTMATVKVNGGIEDGPSGPDDPHVPDITPPANPSLSGLARQAYDWTASVDRSGDYSAAKMRVDASRLAASFRSVAAMIQAGTLGDVSSILKQSKESNDAAVENRNAWLPWFTKMSEYLQQSYNNDVIRTLPQFNSAWLQIAEGLEAAAQN